MQYNCNIIAQGNDFPWKWKSWVSSNAVLKSFECDKCRFKFESVTLLSILWLNAFTLLHNLKLDLYHIIKHCSYWKPWLITLLTSNQSLTIVSILKNLDKKLFFKFSLARENRTLSSLSLLSFQEFSFSS